MRNDDILWASLFELAPKRERPLQVQIRQALVSAIRAGRLGGGTRLPATRELAATLGVARNTVALAYQQLLDEGFLVARPRSGFFVAENAGPPVRPLAPPRGGPGPDWERRIVQKPSADRNIVKARDWQSYRYPFLYGQFDPALFPINAWRECSRMALSVMEIRDWAPDLIDGDDPELVDQLRRHVLPRRGIWASADEIIVTLGAQQALYLTASLLRRPGNRVGVEDPGYPDARNIFARSGAEVVPLAVDGNGLVVGEACHRCDLVYVTPGVQCPTTVRLSRERRRDLLALARERDLVILEDDFETAFSGEEAPVPALKNLDRDGRVLYIGSLSKVIAPGLRIGYIVAPAPVARELRALRRLMLRHPPMNNQRAASLFISLGHYDSHLRRLREGLRQRAAAVDAGLSRFGAGFAFRRAPGSSGAWIVGPPDLDTEALARQAQARGILIEPGSVFFAGPTPPRSVFRLGFASLPADRIEPGLRLLSELASDRGRRAGSLEPDDLDLLA